MGIVLISLVSAGLVPYLSNMVTGSVTILEEPTIVLSNGAGETVYATLNSNGAALCEINWNDTYEVIDVSETSDSYIYSDYGLKTVYYKCYAYLPPNEFNFVTVNDSIEIVFEEPECSSNADCDDSDPYTEDVCNNPGTVDSYCSYLPIVCLMDNDCDDYLPIVCLTNSDCGIDGWIESLTCSNDDIWQNYITYTCNDPGTSAASCSDSTALKLKEDCGEDYCESWEDDYCKLDDVYHNKICHDKGCLDGACFDDIYMEEEKVQECGISEYTGSNYCYNDDVYRDYITRGCSDSSCTESTSKNKIEDCTNGCIDGRCKVEVCKTICNFGACYEYCVWQ